MRIVNLKLDEEIRFHESVSVCIGYFDGLHLGHQQLVKEAILQAKQNNCLSGLITFDPDPAYVINKASQKKHITTLNERITIAEKLGLDAVFVLHMDEDLMRKSAQEFIEQILIRLNAVHVVCGFDFRFGYKGSGNSDTLVKLGENHFKVSVISEYDYRDEKISSSRIIDCIQAGRCDEVKQLLGRYYSMSGMVIAGNQQGRKHGYPTANLDYEIEKVIPGQGVYAVKVKTATGIFNGMCNVGYNLTYNTSNKISIETYIIDFKDDLYQQSIELYFIEKLRDELRFDSIDMLTQQMNQDLENSKRILQHVEI